MACETDGPQRMLSVPLAIATLSTAAAAEVVPDLPAGQRRPGHPPRPGDRVNTFAIVYSADGASSPSSTPVAPTALNAKYLMPCSVPRDPAGALRAHSVSMSLKWFNYNYTLPLTQHQCPLPVVWVRYLRHRRTHRCAAPPDAPCGMCHKP
eukprot:gene7541-7050_t